MATRSATPPGTYVKICAYEGAKPREVPTDDKNRLLIETIKMLYPDAVGLSYVSRHGNMRVLKTDREYTYFVPPESGYQDNIFYLVYPEKTSSTVPKDSKASVEEKTENVQAILQRLSKYVYAVDGMVACATAVSDNMLATCYHCLSSSIKSGPGVEEEKAHCDAVINLTSASTGKNIQARIVIYSVEKDIALLQTLNDAKLMDGQEIALDDAYVGQPYYILGTPISDDGAPLQVISGRISAKFSRTLDDKNIHNLHGHGGARVGASGGAAFARHLDYGKAHLLGIVASGPSISHDTKIGTFVSSNYVKLISSGTLYAIYEKSVTVNAFKNSPYAFKF